VLDSGGESGYNAGMDGSRIFRPTRLSGYVLLGALALLLTASGGCRPTPPPPTPTPTSTPEPPPTPKTGPATLRIDVRPYGAVVVIDGEERAQSPVTLTLAPASHSVRVEQIGFSSLQETLALEPGGEAMVSGMLADVEPPRLSVGEVASPLTSGQAVELNGTADDNLGVTLLQLWLGDELLGEASTGALRVAWMPEEPGDYQLIARAYDSAGNSADETVTLTVAARPTATPTPLVAPTVTVAQPAISPTPTLAISGTHCLCVERARRAGQGVPLDGQTAARPACDHTGAQPRIDVAAGMLCGWTAGMA